MEKPAYSIEDLTAYLLQKKEGDVDAVLEQHLREDPFLQTVMAGLEKEWEYNNDITMLQTSLTAKRRKVWANLQRALPKPVRAAHHTRLRYIVQQFFYKADHYFYLAYSGKDIHYSRAHFLLGFNCSCVLLLVFMMIYLSSFSEATSLYSTSTLGELTGYKQ